MKGHIRERSPGHFAIILETRDPGTGKRRRRWHSFKGGKRDAQIECARLISAMKGGTYVEPNKLTLAQFMDKWLEHARSKVSPRTHERYGEIITKNIVPALGGTLLTKLRPVQISDAYANALAHGRRDGKGGLSPGTVVYVHRVLKHALADAVRWELLPRNPTDAVDPPKIERGSMTTYDIAQTAELLEVLRGSRLFVPVILGVLCGLRRGEICALRWRHVDLEGGNLAVAESAEQTKAGVRYKPPKSGRGRSVALSATVIEHLREHRRDQAEQLSRLDRRQSDDMFLYIREDGEPMQPRSLTQGWRQAIGQTGLPRIRLHDLRHGHATHLLASGVHPKVASERLGHSRVGITLDLYSHVLPGMQEDAAARVDEALRAALERRAEKLGSKSGSKRAFPA
jgi:integrase